MASRIQTVIIFSTSRKLLYDLRQIRNRLDECSASFRLPPDSGGIAIAINCLHLKAHLTCATILLSVRDWAQT